jgi:hypothetical protein
MFTLVRPLPLSDANIPDTRLFSELDDFVVTTKSQYTVPGPSLSVEKSEDYEPVRDATGLLYGLQLPGET